jgi:preprotein translocase subunit SecG
MLLGFLLVVLVLVCVAMSAVILLQRSEGGALGMGGGPSGFMTARGAGDLLTRTTAILAAVFFGLCLLMTVLSARMHTGGSVVDRLNIHNMSPADLAKAMKEGAPPPATPAPGAPNAPTPGPNTAIFEAPAPQVHTAPAGSPAAQPAPAGPHVASHAASVFGVQTAPQAAPTVAPLARPQPRKPASDLNIPTGPAPSMSVTPAAGAPPAGNGTGGA